MKNLTEGLQSKENILIASKQVGNRRKDKTVIKQVSQHLPGISEGTSRENKEENR